MVIGSMREPVERWATDEWGQPVHIQGNVLWHCPVTVQGETETKLTMKPI